jgi:DUF4097 and DUF4098 domain-containing protein YvlB
MFSLGLSALLLLCSSGCLRAQKPKSEEKISHEFTLTADAGRSTLALYNINGSVTVQGYAGSKILVEATQTITAPDAKTLATGKSELKLGFAQHGDSAVVYMAAPYDSRPHNERNRSEHVRIYYDYVIDYVVKVPYQLNLHVSTVNNGKVLVQDVTGLLDAGNVNGPITLRNVKGTTQAHTVNGNVEAAYAANPPGASSYHTINGQIKVQYPASLGADLHFKSMHGEFYTDFPNAEVLPAQVTKNRENEGDGTVYKLSKDTAVRIGKGGPDLRFETLNGNVTITKL